MTSSPVYYEVSLISTGLYRIVSNIVGPECIVKLRRQGWNVGDDFFNCLSDEMEKIVTSGSRGEGFDFKTSDFDYMFIHRKAVVLMSSTLIIQPYKGIPTILSIETENVSPGFAFIRCLRVDQNNTTLNNALVYRGNDVYVSSKQIKETFGSSSITECHGPCQNLKMLGFEGDLLFTLKCPIWPKHAISFIRRSLHHGWPSDICKDGFLLVPINNKNQQYSDMDDLQWRISFSLAEKKLVHAMNHCQFLCYGLSKLFLNEVLKKATSNEDLLCSYFMKTAIFWEISENQCNWSPLDFLPKFWNVFSRLIKWVSMGYCPNFFMPDNNMFHGKICGEVQTTLLSTLRNLYMDGYSSLLRCSSLFEHLSIIITRPEFAFMLSINEQEYVPITMIERQRLYEICKFDIPINITHTEEIMKTLINMLMIDTDSVQILCAVRLGVNRVLQAYAQNLFSSQNSLYLPNTRNRMGYSNYKTAKYILQKSETFFCMNDFILIRHFYMSGNYHRTIEMIHYTRHKLKSQSYMYRWKLDGDVIITALRQGLSYDTVVKTLIVNVVMMDQDTIVEELIPECLTAAETTECHGSLFIPPLVFLNFLLILSYIRHGENHRRYDILDELQALLYHDDGYHICGKAISWEILGICQQLCGDRHCAYVSYLHALDDEYNDFKQATLGRLNSLGS